MQAVYKKASRDVTVRIEKGKTGFSSSPLPYPYYHFCYLVFPHRKHCDYSRILHYILVHYTSSLKSYYQPYLATFVIASCPAPLTPVLFIPKKDGELRLLCGL